MDKKYGFDKKLNLIAEPNNSNCPDYKGIDNKHVSKKFGETPSTEYEVSATREVVCAICYIDLDRQPRKPNITIRSIQLAEEYYYSSKKV